jgi:hypothetical protein
MVRHRGLFGFFTVLVVAAAFAGIATASASATNLCSEAPNGANECPAGKAYGVGQVFELEAAKPELVSPLLGAFKCESSQIKMKVTELAVGLSAVLEVQKFSFVNCVNAAKACVMSGKPIPGIAQIVRTAAGNGEAFFEAPKGGGNFFIESVCGAVVCKFESASMGGKLTGGNPGQIAFAAAAVKGNPAACGAGKFTANYVATNPKPLWATN